MFCSLSLLDRRGFARSHGAREKTIVKKAHLIARRNAIMLRTSMLLEPLRMVLHNFSLFI